MIGATAHLDERGVAAEQIGSQSCYVEAHTTSNSYDRLLPPESTNEIQLVNQHSVMLSIKALVEQDSGNYIVLRGYQGHATSIAKVNSGSEVLQMHCFMQLRSKSLAIVGTTEI